MTIEFDNTIPIYLQIMDYIKYEILTGNLKPGDNLPSIRVLSERLKVNPKTIQRAYSELEREKITYTQRGKGNFVSEQRQNISLLKKNMAHNCLRNFIREMENLNFTKQEIINLVIKELEEDK